MSAFGVGAALALTTTGLPLNANGDRVGGAFAWFNGYAVIGGLAVVGFSLIHAAAFLALKTEGEVRVSSRRFFTAAAPLALLPLVVWVVTIQLRNGSGPTWALVAVAAVAAMGAWFANRVGREGRAFLLLGVFLVAGAASIFIACYPVVLPSTIDPSFDLTISNASSSNYTLGVMTVVACFGLPLVLAYQAWTYWIFRKRISGSHIPEARPVVPAVRQP